MTNSNCNDCKHKTNFYDHSGAFHDRCDHEEIKSSNPNNYDRIVETGEFECPLESAAKIKVEAKKLTWERFLEVIDIHNLLLYDKKGRIRGYKNKTFSNYGPSNVFAWASRKFGNKGFKQCEEFFFRLDEIENEACKNKK